MRSASSNTEQYQSNTHENEKSTIRRNSKHFFHNILRHVNEDLFACFGPLYQFNGLMVDTTCRLIANNLQILLMDMRQLYNSTTQTAQ